MAHSKIKVLEGKRDIVVSIQHELNNAYNSLYKDNISMLKVLNSFSTNERRSSFFKMDPYSANSPFVLASKYNMKDLHTKKWFQDTAVSIFINSSPYDTYLKDIFITLQESPTLYYEILTKLILSKAAVIQKNLTKACSDLVLEVLPQ